MIGKWLIWGMEEKKLIFNEVNTNFLCVKLTRMMSTTWGCCTFLLNSAHSNYFASFHTFLGVTYHTENKNTTTAATILWNIACRLFHYTRNDGYVIRYFFLAPNYCAPNKPEGWQREAEFISTWSFA